MNILGRYENIVSKNPKVALVIVIVITLIMGYFASNVQMSFSEGDFQPDSEVALANQKVNEEYGTQATQVSTIFVSDSNVLKKESLLLQLELEEKILNSTVSSVLSGTRENPSGISSPAKIIAQSYYFNIALTELYRYSAKIPENKTLNMQVVQGELLTMMINLKPYELQSVINGKNLTLNLNQIGEEIQLEFKTYSSKNLEEYLSKSPFSTALDFLLSKDYKLGTSSAEKSLFVIRLKNDLSEEDALEYEKRLEEVMNEINEQSNTINLRMLGNALVNQEISEASGENIALLMPIAFGVVIIILAIIYRNITDTVLNLLALVMAVIWVYGIGVLLDFSFNPMMTTVPILVIGLGIDYGIHYTLRYREELRGGSSITQAITKSGATVGFAILLTTVTTVVGFMSNSISNISSIRQFGILSSVGIISSFIIMLTFFPSAKTIIDKRRQSKGKTIIKEKESKDQGWGFAWNKVKGIQNRPEVICSSGVNCINYGIGTGAVAAKHPLVVILIVGIITTSGVYGGTQLEPRYDFRDFLPKDLEKTETFNMIVEDFNFSQEVVYILVEGDIASPDVFSSLEKIQEETMSSKYTVSTPQSPIQLGISLSNQSSPNFNPEFAEIWRKQVDKDVNGTIDNDISRGNVTSIYSALFNFAPEEANRILARSSTGEFNGLLFRIPVNTQNGEKTKEIENEFQDTIKLLNELDLDRIIITGPPIVSNETFESINQGQVRSVVITFIISLLILTILYIYLRKAPLLGTVTILPLVFVITWTLGSMFFFDIPLNPVTVTIAAIIVGLGIDYSIHLTQRFLEDLNKIEDPECALCVSVNHTGSALFGSAITTVIGFGILSLAIIPPLAQFGQVSALGILFAFLAAVFVLPTFLLLWYKLRQSMKK